MKQLLAILMSAGLAMVLVVSGGSTAVAFQATPAASGESGADLQAATDWLIGQQDASGAWIGFSGEPEVSITVDALIALVAAQLRGFDVGTSIDDAVGYLESDDGALVYAQSGIGPAAKLVNGIVAYGGNPSDISGINPLILVEMGQDTESGFYGSGVFDHALSLLALGATGTEVPEEAITTLENTRTPEGGWSFDGETAEGAADSNTTALVIMGLVAAGLGDSPLVGDALAYLQTTLVGDTGATFQSGDGAVADANSTALVIQAVIAVGDDPGSNGWGDLESALASFQNESGAFFYNETDTSDNLFATAQAIPAAAGFALPIVTAPNVEQPPATPVGFRSGAWAA